MNGTCIITLCYRRCWRSRRDSTVSGCSVRSEPCSPDSSSCRTQRWRSSWPTEVRQQTHTHTSAHTDVYQFYLSFFLLLVFVLFCYTFLFIFVFIISCFIWLFCPFSHSFFVCVATASVMFNLPDRATVKKAVYSLPRVGVGTSYGLPQDRWVHTHSPIIRRCEPDDPGH